MIQLVILEKHSEYDILNGWTNVLLDFEIGFFSGLIAVSLPTKIKLTSAQIKQIAKALSSMIIGDLMGVVK